MSEQEPGPNPRLAPRLITGFTYTNMHTGVFPAGEIRGQLEPSNGHDGETGNNPGNHD